MMPPEELSTRCYMGTVFDILHTTKVVGFLTLGSWLMPNHHASDILLRRL
jgi:hypothetical protein